MNETHVKVRAYECMVRGESIGSVIHAETASKARYQYLLHIGDVIPDLKIMDINVRSLGEPRTDSAFQRTAKYRGVPFAKIGMRVLVDGEEGVIVGNNYSANFNVLMRGCVLNCHPNWKMRFFAEDGTEIGGAQ